LLERRYIMNVTLEWDKRFSELAPHNSFNNFQRWSLGYDKVFRAMVEATKIGSQTYPPHNLIKESETEYRLELAVAGFKQEDVSIVQKELELTISGTNSNKEEEKNVLHKGIASRSFSKTFYLSDRIEVTEASFEDGMIIIKLNQNIPEDKKPKFIEFK